MNIDNTYENKHKRFRNFNFVFYWFRIYCSSRREKLHVVSVNPLARSGHGVFKLLLPLTPFDDLNNQKHTRTREKEKQAQNQTVIKIPDGGQPSSRSRQATRARVRRRASASAPSRDKTPSRPTPRTADSAGIGAPLSPWSGRDVPGAIPPLRQMSAERATVRSLRPCPGQCGGGWCELLGTVEELLAFPRGTAYSFPVRITVPELCHGWLSV
jgi:hypothetical protein